MPLLNLHLHTRYSDGCNDMRTMALLAKELGHVALVTSDHDYCMTPEKYEEQIHEAMDLSAELGFNIICGLEMSLCREEAVLVGRDACRAWMNYRDNLPRVGDQLDEMYRKIPLKDITATLAPHLHGLCLVHPSGFETTEFYKMFHCYEVMNRGRAWPVERVAVLQALMPNAHPVRGMDTHSARFHAFPCNEVPPGQWSEAAVIHWMRTGEYAPEECGVGDACARCRACDDNKQSTT